MSVYFSLLFKMFLRDLRAKEFNLLGVALIVAVAALTSVSFLTSRVELSLEREASQLLGGDVLLAADHPLPAEFERTATQQGLRVAHTVLLSSMASHNTHTLMVGVKAVSTPYPLRGELHIAATPEAPGTRTDTLPAPGEIWLDERAATDLQAQLGDTIEIGYLHLRFAARLTFESERGTNMLSLAPRVIVPIEQLGDSGLMGPGTRATWRLHVAGDEAQVRTFQNWAQAHLGRGERIETLENARPEVRNMLDKTQRFLRLAALLSVILAAVAVGLASHRFMARHLDACAILRCLGAQHLQLLMIFLGEFILFGLICSSLGAALGWCLQWALGRSASELVGSALPAPSLLPVLQGLVVGIVLLVGFTLPQLLRLAKVPTLRVLRRDMAALEPIGLFSGFMGVAALSALVFWMAQDAALGALVSAGFSGALLGFAGLAWGVLQLTQLARGQLTGGWRYGLAALARRKASSILQITALGLGLTSLLLLTVIQNDLLASWKKSIPPDAPNHFIINIQPDQAEGVRAFFQQHALPPPALLPMIRGRMTAINGQPVRAENYPDERTQRLAEREFNLSYSAVLQTGNTVRAGRWHGTQHAPQWSVEKKLAESFNLKLGDVVQFDIAGTPVTAAITSVRELDWNSMQVNFFFIGTADMLHDQASSLITSIHLPPQAPHDFTPGLVAAYPNLTVIDVGAILEQLQTMTQKLILIVQAVFGFALLAGGVVLYAALQATQDERQYELAMLRTLGARNLQLRQALYTEFALLGGCAGLLAGLGASALGWAIATYGLKIPYALNLTVLGTGMLAGALGVVLAGAWGTRKMWGAAPLQSLRAFSA